MLKRTIPYGSRLNAKIVEYRPSQKMVMLVDESGEGHIIIGGDHKIEYLLPDTQVTMEFTRGGPTGGYWRIIGAPGTGGANSEFVPTLSSIERWRACLSEEQKQALVAQVNEVLERTPDVPAYDEWEIGFHVIAPGKAELIASLLLDGKLLCRIIVGEQHFEAEVV